MWQIGLHFFRPHWPGNRGYRAVFARATTGSHAQEDKRVLLRTNGQRDSVRPNPKDEEGFKRLAEASLVRAIDDAAGGSSRTADSAIRWLAGDTAGGLTFDRCCTLIGLTPAIVRSGLRRNSEPIRLRFDRYRQMP